MSRGIARWLSCATAITFAHALGWNSRRTKQLLFSLFVALEWLPDHSHARALFLGWTAIQYALSTLVIFQVARCLLATSNTAKWTGHGRVLLFPCKTTHSRLFPKKHSFVYSYLVVGIPVGWEGISGGMVSCSSSEQSWYSRLRRGWFHVDPADYLHRGDRHLGLRGKLDVYLRAQVGAPDDEPDQLAESQLTWSPRGPTRPLTLMHTWLQLPDFWDIILTQLPSGIFTQTTCHWLHWLSRSTILLTSGACIF